LSLTFQKNYSRADRTFLCEQKSQNHSNAWIHPNPKKYQKKIQKFQYGTNVRELHTKIEGITHKKFFYYLLTWYGTYHEEISKFHFNKI